MPNPSLCHSFPQQKDNELLLAGSGRELWGLKQVLVPLRELQGSLVSRLRAKAHLGHQELWGRDLRSRMRGKRRSLWLGLQGSQDSRERRDRKKGNSTRHIL